MRIPRLELSLLVSCFLLSACGGGGGGASSTTPTATKLELLAGHIGGPGNIDGVGATARFNNPNAAVRAPSGEIYVADSANHLIRRIDTNGQVSIWAGMMSTAADGRGGHADGERLAAQFYYPSGIAIGGDGTLYVADRGNAVIRAISPAGIVRTLAGQVSQPGSTDGVGISAKFAYPASLLVEPSGSLLVMETSGSLRTVSPEGAVSTVATRLPENLQITGSGFNKAGHRLVAGRYGSLSGAALYRLDDAGNATLLAGDPWVSGTVDGDSASARFGTITSILEDAEGNLLIADDFAYLFAGSRTVPTGGITIRKLSANGMVSTVAGRGLVSGGADGDSASSLLCGPKSVSPYDGTHWLVADSCNHAIRLLGSDGQLKTIAGSPPTTGFTQAAGDQARFSNPMGIATLQDGSAYIADFGNSSIRRISATGQSSQLSAIDENYGPTALASNGTTDLCFADAPRYRYFYASTIRCVGADGTVRELVSSVNIGSTQKFGSISGIAFDRQGNWLFTEAASTSSNLLYSVNSAGTLSTLAKASGTVGAIASSPDGAVYLRIGSSIQKRNSDGSLSLVAGSVDNSGFQNGDGAQARFGSIDALAVDAQHYLYVADYSSAITTIRLITPTGQVSTLAGTPGLTGVRLGSAPGSLATIRGLAVSADQKSLLATTANGVIRITLQR